MRQMPGHAASYVFRFALHIQFCLPAASMIGRRMHGTPRRRVGARFFLRSLATSYFLYLTPSFENTLNRMSASKRDVRWQVRLRKKPARTSISVSCPQTLLPVPPMRIAKQSLNTSSKVLVFSLWVLTVLCTSTVDVQERWAFYGVKVLLLLIIFIKSFPRSAARLQAPSSTWHGQTSPSCVANKSVKL